MAGMQLAGLSPPSKGKFHPLLPSLRPMSPHREQAIVGEGEGVIPSTVRYSRLGYDPI